MLRSVHDAQMLVVAFLLEVLCQRLSEGPWAGDAVVLLFLLSGTNGLLHLPRLVRENVIIIKMFQRSFEDFGALLCVERDGRLIFLYWVLGQCREAGHRQQRPGQDDKSDVS